MVDITTLLASVTEQLLPVYKNHDAALHTAWLLLEKLIHMNRVQLLTMHTLKLSHEQDEQLAQWLYAITHEHMPVQYILGSVEFLTTTIAIKPPILIPRPETEAWCAQLIDRYKPVADKKLSVLDLCTGSGCIALALAHAFPHAQIYATDTSDQALACARDNMNHNAITNVTVLKSDLYQEIPDTLSFDLIVANPPYIASEEWPLLDPEVKNWEDWHALVAHEGGLAIIKKIIQQAPLFLSSSRILPLPAQVWIEIGYRQADDVCFLFTEQGFTNIHVLRDAHNRDRVVIGEFNPV